MVGKVLGPYRVIEPVGAGGMGEVYRARDDRLERDVAVKVLPAAQAGDEDARARLLREARAAAALNHPHICTIHEVGEAGGQAYIAMEFIDGRPLDQVIPPGGLPARDVLAYGLQMTDAVAHAHERGVLHRDLKAANVVITAAGRVKVLDFGLAKRVRIDDPDATTRGPATLTEPGQLAGTPAYMAPEQLRGQPASARSDVWALGVVLHEMASGRRPFAGRTGFEIASAILEQTPPPLPDRVPAELRAVVDRCLMKDPGRRYANAGELQAALEAVGAGTAPAVSAARPARTGKVTRLAIGSAAVVVLAVLAAFGLSSVLDRVGGPLSRPKIASIAVLPLENLSGNPDEDYFAAGLQDGLIAELARLRSLDRVTARRSTLRFTQTELPVTEVAAALGVEAVLTGSVLRAGGRVQLAAQVIDAESGEPLWTDRFERDMRDVLTIPNDATAAVAEAIGLELTPEEEQRLGRRDTIDTETYEAYLRGMYLIDSAPPTRERRQQGLAILQEAIERDPANARAYAGLAYGNVTLGHGPAATVDVWPRAREAALRAITLDPDLAEAHAALAEVRAYYERDWPGAEASFRRANELNPNLAMSHYHFAWYHALFGRFDEAIAEHKRAQEIDPLTPPHTTHLGTLYLYQGRYDEAIAEATKATEFAPRAPGPWNVIGAALSAKGRHDEAIAAVERAVAGGPTVVRADLGLVYAAAGRLDEARAILREIEAEPPVPFSGWALSQLYVALGDHDGAFRWLAHRPAHAFLPWIRVHPPFAPLRKDPRFAALMAELKLPNP